MIMKKTEYEAVQKALSIIYKCPSCGEFIQGDHSIKEHWESHKYEKIEACGDFVNYKRIAQYEYEVHKKSS